MGPPKTCTAGRSLTIRHPISTWKPLKPDAGRSGQGRRPAPVPKLRPAPTTTSQDGAPAVGPPQGPAPGRPQPPVHGVDGFDRPLAILHAFDAPASPSAQPALSLLGRDPAACLEKLEAAGPRYTSRITFNTNVLKQAAAASPAWAKELAAAGAAKMERLLVGATPQRIMRLQYMVESGSSGAMSIAAVMDLSIAGMAGKYPAYDTWLEARVGHVALPVSPRASRSGVSASPSPSPFSSPSSTTTITRNSSGKPTSREYATVTTLVHDIWAPFAKQPAEESAESEDDSGATSSGASEAQAEAAAAQKARLDWAQEFVTKRGPATAKAPSAWSPESPTTFDAGQGGGVRLYGGALRCTDRLRPGTIVRLADGSGLYMVQCIFAKPRAEEAQGGSGAEVHVQLRRVLHGYDTALHDAACAHELFLLDFDPSQAAAEAAEVARWERYSRRPQTAVTSGNKRPPLWDTLKEVTLAGLAEAEVVEAVCLAGRPNGHQHRLDHLQADRDLAAANEARRAQGLPPVFAYRSVYSPALGMYRQLDVQELRLGTYLQVPPLPAGPAVLPGGAGFTLNGTTYRVGDFLFVDGDALDPPKGSTKAAPGTPSSASDEASDGEVGPTSSARTSGHSPLGSACRAWGVVQLVAVEGVEGDEGDGSKAKGNGKGRAPPFKLRVHRYYRPEDISADLAYPAGWWDLYAPAPAPAAAQPVGGGKSAAAQEQEQTGPTSSSVGAGGAEGADPWVYVVGPGCVRGAARVERRSREANAARKAAAAAAPGPDAKERPFYVVGSFDPRTATRGPAPNKLETPELSKRIRKLTRDGHWAVARAAGGGGELRSHPLEAPPCTQLRTFELFAGCGGLGEGMRQAGVADSRWAIEFDPQAAEAFRINHPEAQVVVNDISVLLQAAMNRAGQSTGYVSGGPATSQAAATLPLQQPGAEAALPLPGEVELMMGGSPCQGFSGSNRHPDSRGAHINNSMLRGFLSYADFYRPRYFLLENVRNLVVHDGGRTFRLAVRSLLDMGYQVRFGVLQAAHYGVPQSRLRTFVWAAAPGEQLPAWPAPRHAAPPFSGGLGIRLRPDDRDSFRAVEVTGGAPLRATTVRDAIGDLPPISNGHKGFEMEYGDSKPVSPFQRLMRAEAQRVMRAKAQPPLYDHITKTMSPANVDNIRNGVFDRLTYGGRFPTVHTDPHPNGRKGAVHPEQHRVVSVRECARSQGFPDHFRFAGDMPHRYRQVGNAVPPPLARALGEELARASRAGAARAGAGAVKAEEVEMAAGAVEVDR